MTIIYRVPINQGKGNNSTGKWTENTKTYFMKKMQLSNNIHIRILEHLIGCRINDNENSNHVFFIHRIGKNEHIDNN